MEGRERQGPKLLLNQGPRALLRHCTERRYFGVYVTINWLWNRRWTKYGDLLALGTARGPQRRPVEAVERQ